MLNPFIVSFSSIKKIPSRHCSAELRKSIFPERNAFSHRSRPALYSVVARDRDKWSETSQRCLKPSIYLPRFSDTSRNVTSAAWRRRKCCQLDLYNINHTLLLCHIKWPIFSFQSPRRRISVVNRRHKIGLNECRAHAASHELVHDITFHHERCSVNMISFGWEHTLHTKPHSDTLYFPKGQIAQH